MRKSVIFAIDIIGKIFILLTTLHLKDKYHLNFWKYFAITFPLLWIVSYLTKKLTKDDIDDKR